MIEDVQQWQREDPWKASIRSHGWMLSTTKYEIIDPSRPKRCMVLKDISEVMKSLKLIYQASTLQLAEDAMKELRERWYEKYPYMVKSWTNNWPRLSTYFQYPQDIRRTIYTTNIIESFHSQLRKITKSKRVFSSNLSLLKLLFLVYHNLEDGWKLTYAQLMILFENRMAQP